MTNRMMIVVCVVVVVFGTLFSCSVTQAQERKTNKKLQKMEEMNDFCDWREKQRYENEKGQKDLVLKETIENLNDRLEVAVAAVNDDRETFANINSNLRRNAICARARESGNPSPVHRCYYFIFQNEYEKLPKPTIRFVNIEVDGITQHTIVYDSKKVYIDRKDYLY